jgi:hypothetical protein
MKLTMKDRVFETRKNRSYMTTVNSLCSHALTGYFLLDMWLPIKKYKNVQVFTESFRSLPEERHKQTK